MGVLFRNIKVSGKGKSLWGKGMRVAMGVTGKHYFSVINFLMFKLCTCISFTKN